MSEKQSKLSNQFEVPELSFEDFKNIVIKDYRICFESRQASLIGRREVLTGKAKFGIFGDGKEVAQIAMAKVFQKGDWRSGYYRDQTFMFATGMATITEFFSQLYANTDVKAEPFSGGRQMNCHFSTRVLNEDGSWKNQMLTKNTSADISTTGGQMARLVGLAQASKLYRNNPDLSYLSHFSAGGNEVAFGTIGNGSTSEGVFFEAINAAGVLQIPMAVSIWDDGFAISVPSELQTTKQDISEVLKGFQRDEKGEGFEIFKVKGWDYAGLCETYEKAIAICREKQIPVMIHVYELTQPQGHSTSGSHERYKSKERLAWEMQFDCLLKMRNWMIESAIINEEELAELETKAIEYVRVCRKNAWDNFQKELRKEADEAEALLKAFDLPVFNEMAKSIHSSVEVTRREIMVHVRKTMRTLIGKDSVQKQDLQNWYQEQLADNNERYNSKLFTDSFDSHVHVPVVAPIYDADSKLIDGREILNGCFDANFARDARIIAFGEDVGSIGDVNQGFAGLQDKFGKLRVADTGIRESTIIGQGIGLGLRGLKPIAEIQYIDYILYAINVISDDLASLSYRTKGGQKAPLIIRTRGHRLEGVWHSGSPMAAILGIMRGVHICVPRNMTQAAGMYNTLLRADEPALVVECLNGYRLKERLPSNVGDFTVALGKAELMREGKDITIVSYGSTLRVVQEVAEELEHMGISIEIIDLQTLHPFDLDHLCAQSLKKTNKLLIVDEDVPGGASAYILQQILEKQNGYYHLDSAPRTITAKEHRPPYGTDGDYFSKPSTDDIIEVVYEMMSETNPSLFPPIY
ncbi:alpha-ketoacid dehydrogenase subunit alpha/beta [Arcticibacter eurypsychrophilus]|uniref:alpha-ketoacid dehydrogenase subunit alpha/beta n=1 Tax=Arcticibacter eurypsychrophilus TaxID=1434752 RepID=UPI00084DF296|nr:alpha-ketoacid dehydrogenase subunit alpha/beta [Arcticibacter eurypsychrophilus]